MIRTGLMLAALLALGGCFKGENANGPGGVSVREARGLDAAAAKIDATRPSPPPAERAPPSSPASASPAPAAH